MSTTHRATPENWQEVSAVAEPGDTIILVPGAYDCPLELPAGVLLKGSCRRQDTVLHLGKRP